MVHYLHRCFKAIQGLELADGLSTCRDRPSSLDDSEPMGCAYVTDMQTACSGI